MAIQAIAKGLDMTTSIALDATHRDPTGINDIIAGAYLAHAAAIRGVALRSTRDPELAEDVTQEAFLRLLVEAQAGRHPDNVAAWLHRTSANLIVSRARRTAVARRLAPRLVESASPQQPDAIAVMHEQHHELRVALAALPAVDRTALLLAAQGATGEEIADHLGRSHGATRTVLCRARRRLRDVASDTDPHPVVGQASQAPFVAGLVA